MPKTPLLLLGGVNIDKIKLLDVFGHDSSMNSDAKRKIFSIQFHQQSVLNSFKQFCTIKSLNITKLEYGVRLALSPQAVFYFSF